MPSFLETVEQAVIQTEDTVIGDELMMMNCFCGMVDHRNALSRAVRSEPVQNLSSAFVE